ncbi:phage tail length tape measure family protein [Rhizobium skierniewicense]|uniref:phage tail length tape measure family protein n=1 Tax=Rhizobium skierniewicense TaxID=984260 RepID=UPI001FACB459|nr:phage tail length tape measure family protein [Rhizobium skierniewicense]MCI9864877.1 phage tail length tape measure family protein [Rhizobium skierniewicense]
MKISARVEIDATPAQRGSADSVKAVETIGSAADRTSAQLAKLNTIAGEGLRSSLAVVGGTSSTGAQDAAAAALDRLKAKYDPVIAAQQRYKSRVQEIAQAQAAGAVSASQAIDLRLREKASFDALISSMNNVAAARKASAESAVARASTTPDRGADIAAYGAELDKLRMRYNPLYAVITQYKQAQEGARQAHAAGAIDADELTAALSRQRQAALASIDVIKGRNKAIADTPVAHGARGFETANIAAQFQDIGVTAAMGMSPLQIALQQGTQLSSVIGSMQNPVRGLAAAFMSVVSPVSLVTIGVVAAGAAAIQYFTSTGEKAKSADVILKAHAETIASLKERYGEAASGLREFVTEGITGTAVDLRDRLKDAQDLIKEAATARSTYSVMISPFAAGTDPKILSDWRQAFVDLRKSIADGKPDILSFRNSMALIADNTNVPEGLRKLAKEMRTFKEEGVVDTARAIPGMVQQLNLIGGSASNQIRDVKALSGALRDLAGIAMPSLTDADKISAATNAGLRALANGGTINEEARRRLLLQQQAAQQRLANQNPTVINSDGNRTNVPVPGSKPVTLGDRDRASERSATSTANAYRDLIKTADDRVAQMKLEAQLAGQTGVASDALRFKLDLLQQSEDKGRSLTSSQVEAINKRVEAFKKYAEEAGKATLKADLLFEREQMGRSAMDQQIASGLRGAGLEIDFDSYEAGLIRTNLQLQYARELAGDFANTFFSSFEQGKSVFESLGDAGVSALKRIANTMLNDVLNSIFSVNSAMSGSGGGGGFFSNLLNGIGSLFGGGGKFPSAPGGLYDQGGYTGPGGVHEARGVVHAGEIVWSQRNIADAGGVATVEAMRLGRRGYNDGGVVGVVPLLSPRRSGAASASAADRGLREIKISVEVNGARGNREIEEMVNEGVANGVEQGLMQYDQQLPDRLAQIDADPRLR